MCEYSNQYSNKRLSLLNCLCRTKAQQIIQYPLCSLQHFIINACLVGYYHEKRCDHKCLQRIFNFSAPYIKKKNQKSCKNSEWTEINFFYSRTVTSLAQKYAAQSTSGKQNKNNVLGIHLILERLHPFPISASAGQRTTLTSWKTMWLAVRPSKRRSALR